ncbi:MAG: hypothetical protein H3Z52_13175 [archaeon]|nr:hypothetical protein [archaeon]MCP8321868.1 hypothetical protein [archaeon]
MSGDYAILIPKEKLYCVRCNTEVEINYQLIFYCRMITMTMLKCEHYYLTLCLEKEWKKRQKYEEKGTLYR